MTDDGMTPEEIERALEIGPPDFLLDPAEGPGALAELHALAAENTAAMAAADPRTPDEKRRDADGVDYGSLERACPSGHNHYCPECGRQHMHDGGNHPDCELRGFDHSWNRWERHALDDRVMFRLCDRCGCSERSRLET